MLRDRLVVGIRDTGLSEKLQTDPDLTSERAKTMIRQKEAAREHRRELQEDSKKESSLCRVSGQFQRRPLAGRGRPQSTSRAPKGGTSSQCSKGGKPQHQRGERCPAAGAVCHTCHKKGHFSAKCYSKEAVKTNVDRVISDSALSEVFLGTVTAAGDQHPWVVKLQLSGQSIAFKLDTGAEVSAITEDTYKCLGEPRLSKPSRVIYGPARQQLHVLGQFSARLTKGTRSTDGLIYVVRGLNLNLLSLQMLTALQLVRRVNTNESFGEQDVKKQFPTFFQGLGVLGED